MANRDTRNSLLSLAIIVVVLLVIAFVLRNIAVSWAPARDQYPVQGISVDESHGEIIWHVAGATGVDFAYIQATRGANKRDANFAANIKGAREAGIRYGAFHTYSLCRLATDSLVRRQGSYDA